jgi:hypothetical protein
LKSVPHERPAAHPGAHAPPHPSEPHSLPLHAGVQHEPATVHVCPAEHPQSPGQLLQVSPGSQVLLPQKTSPLHCPSIQESPTAHPGAHVPPHPSDPHDLPAQVAAGLQHMALKHRPPIAHVQSKGHVEQSSFNVGSQDPLPHAGIETHCPVSQRNPLLHPGAHVPPHPSSPQTLPAQFGLQQVACRQAPAPHPQSPGQLSQVSPISQTPFPQ